MSVATAFEGRATWDDIAGAAWQLGPWSQWVKAQPGRNLSLAVPLLPASGGSLASCSAGQYDSYWAKLANQLASYGLDSAYLRLGWEMDGTWYPWSAAPGSGKEASFAGCFRRVVQVMRQTQPANQWKFVLNPTANWTSKAYLDAIWPGDAYVDVVAIDLYDQSWAANTYPYPSSCDSACRLTHQQNAWNNYSWHLYTIRDFATAHGKTVGLPEWGVAIRSDGHGGGDNAYYIRKMYEFINDPANNVAYYSYWDVVAPDLNAQLSGTTQFPQSAALFKQLFGAAAGNTGNTPPTVSITAPTAGNTVSGTISYAANASDNAGLSRVDFFVDSSALASDTTAPYGGSLDTTKLANGTHTLKAVAYDAQGLSATSQVSINIQNTVPTPTPSTPPPAVNGAGTPFSGSPISLPAMLEAENFDKGGEGVGYHDLTANNTGGRYRTSEGVDIIAAPASEGSGFVVTNFQTGEWLAYTVHIPAGGKYDIALRASNNYASGTPAFHIEVDGVNVSSSIAVPKTGSWNTFQWVEKRAIDLSAGAHVLKIVSDTQYFNLNSIRVNANAASGTNPPSTPSYTGTPYSGTPIALPVAFAAANFDKGGEGVAYHDLSKGNAGGQYRTSEDVDIVTTVDTQGVGTYVVNNFQTGEWLAYTVNVPANGKYDLAIRAANNYGSAKPAFHVEVDGKNVTGTVTVPQTAGWDVFQWVGKRGIDLTAGKHVLKLVADAQYFNVNAISVLQGATTVSTNASGTSTSTPWSPLKLVADSQYFNVSALRVLKAGSSSALALQP